MRGIAGSQMGIGANEPVFDELDDRGVIHRRVRNIMPPSEGRDDHIRHAEAKLCGKAVDGRGIARMSSGVIRPEVAVEHGRAAGWQARVVGIGIDRNR